MRDINLGKIQGVMKCRVQQVISVALPPPMLSTGGNGTDIDECAFFIWKDNCKVGKF